MQSRQTSFAVNTLASKSKKSLYSAVGVNSSVVFYNPRRWDCLLGFLMVAVGLWIISNVSHGDHHANDGGVVGQLRQLPVHQQRLCVHAARPAQTGTTVAQCSVRGNYDLLLRPRNSISVESRIILPSGGCSLPHYDILPLLVVSDIIVYCYNDIENCFRSDIPRPGIHSLPRCRHHFADRSQPLQTIQHLRSLFGSIDNWAHFGGSLSAQYSVRKPFLPEPLKYLPVIIYLFSFLSYKDININIF